MNSPDGEFYDNIYTGQRVSQPGPEESGDSWQCHICTFSNHGLLNKCEECDMPRIILGRPPSAPLAHSVSQGLLSVLPLVQSPTNTAEDCSIESLILSMDHQIINPDAKVHATNSASNNGSIIIGSSLWNFHSCETFIPVRISVWWNFHPCETFIIGKLSLLWNFQSCETFILVKLSFLWNFYSCETFSLVKL